MLNKVLEAIKKNSIDIYRINDVSKETAELFFVKKSLDTRRIEKYDEIYVTVFNRFEKAGNEFLGSADFRVQPSMTDKEIEEGLKTAYLAAGFVCNKPFSMAEGIKKDKVTPVSELANMSANAIADSFAEALFRNDTRKEAFINSAEIFVEKSAVRILNSNGLDVAYDDFEVKGEFVAQCKSPIDVENYNDFSYNDLDTDALADKVKEVLQAVQDRAVAKTNPVNGKATVILSDVNAYKVLDYYEERIRAQYIYMKYFENGVGDFIQGKKEDIKGNVISLELLPSVPYSNEGIERKQIKAVDNGVIKAIEADLRFGEYLGVPATGTYSKIGVECGSMSFEDMKKQKGLYCVTFSDFELDPILGVFRGEIRLAYYNDGEKIIPVTGGSVNGAILDVQKNIVLSKEKIEMSNYSGPKAIMIADVSVAGI